MNMAIFTSASPMDSINAPLVFGMVLLAGLGVITEVIGFVKFSTSKKILISAIVDMASGLLLFITGIYGAANNKLISVFIKEAGDPDDVVEMLEEINIQALTHDAPGKVKTLIALIAVSVGLLIIGALISGFEKHFKEEDRF